ncbi:hypothetical protein [Endozoicomonas sp. ALC013]|uniref:hypothetical protein n=1 Tax=Endozoicomonas sp. ALC013 TaxID=3403076 RepID=UPI003BB61027
MENSSDKSIKYTLPSTPDIPFDQQIFLPTCQPETSKATQTYHLNPVYLLINLPDEVSEPQMSPPATAITPLNLNQTSSDNIQAKKIVEAPPSIMKRQNKLRSERQKARYQNDPAFAEREKKRSREQRIQRRKNQGIRYPGSSA